MVHIRFTAMQLGGDYVGGGVAEPDWGDDSDIWLCFDDDADGGNVEQSDRGDGPDY